MGLFMNIVAISLARIKLLASRAQNSRTLEILKQSVGSYYLFGADFSTSDLSTLGGNKKVQA